MESYQQSLIDEWPKVSFEEIENIEIEDRTVRIFYKSFFGILHLPETTIKAFWTILKQDVL
ncbi:hypothetical protein HYS29_00485 [Candidatus Microgenomates bacterium]|nr:hypothetical protein [Candidatus Microgenomates bacterium]MBI2622212.1 hypothetical protein [Candidatus Microgenomates bacterium]